MLFFFTLKALFVLKIFKFLLKNHAQDMVEIILKPFFKKIKIKYISGSIVYSFIKFAFIISYFEGYRNILNSSCKSLAFTSDNAFLKNKKLSGTCLLTSFTIWFSRKNIFLVILYNWPSFIACNSWNIEQYVYCRIVLQCFDDQTATSQISKLTLSF